MVKRLPHRLVVHAGEIGELLDGQATRLSSRGDTVSHGLTERLIPGPLAVEDFPVWLVAAFFGHSAFRTGGCHASSLVLCTISASIAASAAMSRLAWAGA